jgi:hypothetical protein
MTTPNMTFLDMNNPLGGGGPSRLDTGGVTLPTGEKVGVVTMRTTSTTCTALLTPEVVLAWGEHLVEFAGQLGAKKLVAASMADVAALDAMRSGR